VIPVNAVQGAESFAATWAAAVAKTPHRVFLLFERDTKLDSWTYRQFDEIVERTAASLCERGVRAGAPVHISLSNCPAFVAVWLAVSRLGAWMTAGDPRATADEISAQLVATSPVLCITATSRRDTYLAAMEHSNTSMPVITLAEEARDVREGSALVSGNLDGLTNECPDPRDRLAVMFTSGTTSKPKGVVLTQALYAHTGAVMAQAARLTQDDRWLVVLPLFHANAQYYCLASAINVGASVALLNRFSASQWVAQARRLEVTHASLFAAPIRMILARDASGVSGASARLKHLWYAQNLTLDEYDSLAALVGVRPRQLYGMTETGPAVLTDRSPRPIHDSLGTPTLGCHVKLADDDSGLPGEILVEGRPGLTLFDGYLDDPRTTRALMSPADADGLVWFRTGDRALLHPSGRYTFVGRSSEIIKVGGENVSLSELDMILSEHPSVREAVAVAIPHRILDEVVAAVVVPYAQEGEFDQVAFLAWCARRLSPARCPQEVIVVASLPKTSVGKVRRHLAR
jgi:crotonobetaine/carnitine-CoA ligase